MPTADAAVSRMLANYRELIRRFVIGDISANEFEKDYELFSYVDDYVADPALREHAGGISCEVLRARSRDVYTRLFDAGV